MNFYMKFDFEGILDRNILDAAVRSAMKHNPLMSSVIHGTSSNVTSTEKLLKIGFREEALCEMAELETAERPDRLAIRSLLLSATGQWLDAIKTFSNIPRAYRRSCGMSETAANRSTNGPVAVAGRISFSTRSSP